MNLLAGIILFYSSILSTLCSLSVNSIGLNFAYACDDSEPARSGLIAYDSLLCLIAFAGIV